MAVRYPDINDPRIPELIPNQRLIDIREQFGVPGEFLLDDYNQYYTNMNDNQPIEKIDDGVSPDFKEYIMAGGGSGGGGGVTPELLGSQDGAIGYVRPLDSKDGITSLQNSMTGSFDITPVTKEEFEKNRALNSRFIDYNDYFQKTVADGQFSFPKEKTGILQNIKDGGSKLLDFIKGGGVIGNIIGGLLPEQDPRAIFMRNYYGGKDGSNLTSSGSIASGLMKGYNPVSGGGLYTLTGGRYGDEPTYGLQNAYDRRIDTIRKTLAKQANDIATGKRTKPVSEVLRERIEKLREEKAREAEAFRETQRQAEADRIRNTYQQQQQQIRDSGGYAEDGGGGPRRGASDIPDRNRGSYATDDTASFF